MHKGSGGSYNITSRGAWNIARKEMDVLVIIKPMPEKEPEGSQSFTLLLDQNRHSVFSPLSAQVLHWLEKTKEHFFFLEESVLPPLF